MRNLFLCVLFIFSFLVACNQGDKQVVKENKPLLDTVKLDTTHASTRDEIIKSFVKAYAKKDGQAINAMIHPDLGFFVIFRPGVADRFYSVDRIDFANPTPSYYPYDDIAPILSLVYDKLPDFDCGTEKWDKQGLYCDSLSVPNQLSQIVDFEKEFESVDFPASYVKKIVDLEKDSYRVIMTGDIPLIFHIKKYKEGWYITVLDRAYAGCDA